MADRPRDHVVMAFAVGCPCPYVLDNLHGYPQVRFVVAPDVIRAASR